MALCLLVLRRLFRFLRAEGLGGGDPLLILLGLGLFLSLIGILGVLQTLTYAEIRGRRYLVTEIGGVVFLRRKVNIVVGLLV